MHWEFIFFRIHETAKWIQSSEKLKILLGLKQSEPSPTTGTFPLAPAFFNSGSSKPILGMDPSKDRSADQGFVFKPFVKPVPQNSMSRLAGLVSCLSEVMWPPILQIRFRDYIYFLCVNV